MTWPLGFALLAYRATCAREGKAVQYSFSRSLGSERNGLSLAAETTHSAMVYMRR